jgi:hypothetical protein
MDDESAAFAFVVWQPPKDFWYRLLFGPGVDAALAKSRAIASGLVYNWG